jgi:Fe-S oxidoreductase
MNEEYDTIGKFKDVLHKCLRCGFCKTLPKEGDFRRICPPGVWGGFESYYSSGKPRIALGLLDGKIKWSEGLVDSIYSCTSCAACKELCIYDYSGCCLQVNDALKVEAVEHGFIPDNLKKALKNTYTLGNPWGGSKSKREDWTKDLGIKKAGETRSELTYFAGCTVAYDPRNQEVARSFVAIMKKAGIRFSFLGSEEKCCGNEILKIGERGLYETLANENLATFEKHGIRKLATTCPHSYNVFLNEPPYKGRIEVQHHTQLIADSIDSGNLKLLKNIRKSATYHDPCFLGRYNEVYDAPRKILASILGLDVIEMPRNRNYSYCCGGGGGRIWMHEHPSESPRIIRVREAKEINPDIIVTSCPFCLMNLKDGIETIGEDTHIKVMDIAELVQMAL